jgi:Condensation domain
MTDASVTDPPVADPSVTDPSVTDAPVTDAPVTDAPVADAPVADPPVAGAPTIPRRPADLVELPLSVLQQRLWFLCTAYSGDASPTVYLAYRLRGPVDVEALVAALGDVSDRQESLRTRIVERPDGPVAVGPAAVGPAAVGPAAMGPVVVLDPPGGLAVERIDLSDLPPAQREERLERLLAGWTRILFELRGGSLVRARVVRLDDADHVLYVVLHHIIADGASVGVLARELAAHYRARVAGTAPDLPELTIGYGDFAYWQSQGHGTGGLDGLPYWRDRLAGLPVPDLATDRPRPAQKGTRGEDVVHPLDGELAAALERLARSHRCSLFAVLLAGFWALLSRHGGGEDVCVGSPIGGRTRVELEPLIGNFANTLPLRGDLSGDPTFAELLVRARSTVLGALAHQEVPFANVVAALDLPRDPSRMQVFGAILVLQYGGGDRDPLPGLPAEPIPAGFPQITHDVVLDAWRDPAGLWLVFRYDSALFDRSTIVGWAEEFEAMLRGAAADPGTPLSLLAPVAGAGR